MDEAEFARNLDLGHQNARIIELAANHCRHMRFVEFGGRGMLEEMSGLPLNSRRVECPVAIGNMSGMRLDHVAFGTAQGSVDSLPVRLRPRWKDQHRAQAVPQGVPA